MASLANWQREVGTLVNSCCRAALDYTTVYDRVINFGLRKRRLSATGLSLIRNLLALMDSAPGLPQDLVVYRGLQPYTELSGRQVSASTLVPGADIFDEGFTSFSDDFRTAGKFASGLSNPSASSIGSDHPSGFILELRLPAGSKALYLSPRVATSLVNEESEYLLPPCNRFRVTGSYIRDLDGIKYPVFVAKLMPRCVYTNDLLESWLSPQLDYGYDRLMATIMEFLRQGFILELTGKWVAEIPTPGVMLWSQYLEGYIGLHYVDYIKNYDSDASVRLVAFDPEVFNRLRALGPPYQARTLSGQEVVLPQWPVNMGEYTSLSKDGLTLQWELEATPILPKLVLDDKTFAVLATRRMPMDIRYLSQYAEAIESGTIGAPLDRNSIAYNFVRHVLFYDGFRYFRRYDGLVGAMLNSQTKLVGEMRPAVVAGLSRYILQGSGLASIDRDRKYLAINTPDKAGYYKWVHDGPAWVDKTIIFRSKTWRLFSIGPDGKVWYIDRDGDLLSPGQSVYRRQNQIKSRLALYKKGPQLYFWNSTRGTLIPLMVNPKLVWAVTGENITVASADSFQVLSLDGLSTISSWPQVLTVGENTATFLAAFSGHAAYAHISPTIVDGRPYTRVVITIAYHIARGQLVQVQAEYISLNTSLTDLAVVNGYILDTKLGMAWFYYHLALGRGFNCWPQYTFPTLQELLSDRPDRALLLWKAVLGREDRPWPHRIVSTLAPAALF